MSDPLWPGDESDTFGWPVTALSRKKRGVCTPGRQWRNVPIDRLPHLVGDILSSLPAWADYVLLACDVSLRDMTPRDAVCDIEVMEICEGMPEIHYEPARHLVAYLEAILNEEGSCRLRLMCSPTDFWEKEPRCW